MSRYTVNELLCFATSQFDKLDRNVLNSTLIDFYSQQEIFDAKQILLAECDKLSLNADINESRKKRIGQNVEQKLLKDILDIWQVIDRINAGKLGAQYRKIQLTISRFIGSQASGTCC